jgi:hypothetical protein
MLPGQMPGTQAPSSIPWVEGVGGRSEYLGSGSPNGSTSIQTIISVDRAGVGYRGRAWVFAKMCPSSSGIYEQEAIYGGISFQCPL